VRERELEVAIFVELSITERTALLKPRAKALNQLAIVAAKPPIPLDERRNRRRTVFTRDPDHFEGIDGLTVRTV
jgi:hypothetical protein